MTHSHNHNGITIRRLGASDDAAIERLVELDSGNRPEGGLLGAEIEGRLLVATSIETGESVADPFSRTEELRVLVGMRVAQLNGSRQPAKRRWRGGGRTRSRGALAGSPPGAGGKLLTLPVRLS